MTPNLTVKRKEEGPREKKSDLAGQVKHWVTDVPGSRGKGRVGSAELGGGQSSLEPNEENVA
jgi:hypothetical protein